MSNLYLYNEKATLCADKNCITVYGEAAKLINAIAITAVVLIAIALVVKAVR